MKKETKKKINDFEKRALMWSDVEGADELKTILTSLTLTTKS